MTGIVASDVGEARAASAAFAPGHGFLRAGNPRPVLEAALDAVRRGETAVLALVVETEGSTYSRAGGVALFSGRGATGWLSGGCLEPEIARRAATAAASAQLQWIEIDTRDDGALFSGAALGCRGRLRIALLPLAALPGVDGVLERWLAGGCTLQRDVSVCGRIQLVAAGVGRTWQLDALPPDWSPSRAAWVLPLAPLPEVLVLGAGPEAPLVVDLLHSLGWRVTAPDRPEPQRGADGDALESPRAAGGPGLTWQRDVAHAAALVMHHSFERDLEALAALASTAIPFIGLLGPARRGADLMKVLGPDARARLAPRLRSPVGLALGGEGPEAIALSVAAQLQQWRAQGN